MTRDSLDPFDEDEGRTVSMEDIPGRLRRQKILRMLSKYFYNTFISVGSITFLAEGCTSWEEVANPTLTTW